MTEETRLTKSVSYRRQIEWVDGKPIPVEKPSLPKEALTTTLVTALSLPYVGQYNGEGEWKVEPEFQGLTNLEVIALRQVRNAAAGDDDATRFVYDRTIGKPAQTNFNFNTGGSYAEYLDSLVDSEANKTGHAEVIDIANL